MKARALGAASRLALGRGPLRLAAGLLDLAGALTGAPRFLVLAGYARERSGDPRAASLRYGKAIARIQKADDVAAVRWRHAAQFFRERVLHSLGEGREHDPLFSCSALPILETEKGARRSATRGAAGFFAAEFTFAGLQLFGAAPRGATDSVDILLDDRKIRDVKVSDKGVLGTFSFKFTRAALTLFPRESKLRIHTAAGAELGAFGGGTAFALSIPHGAGGGEALLSGERRIDKKGVPVPTAEELEARRRSYLALYADARAFFRERLGKELWLAYGTLLGFHRQGGFIENDDDFDTAFFAEATDPTAVKAEVLGMVFELVAAGFSVSFNRRGRLFRLHARGAGATGIHLDVHSFWAQEGKVWAHNDFRAAESRKDYLPVREGVLSGTAVAVPADPEVFLRDHYGAGWKIPDPGFANYYSAADPNLLRNLALALITPPEYRTALERVKAIRAAKPGAGEFSSLGARDFYPLSAWGEDLE